MAPKHTDVMTSDKRRFPGTRGDPGRSD